MCGINLIISKKGLAPDSAILRLTQANVHRGPDATVYYKADYGQEQGQIYFGHNRLKIIDLSNEANQPLFSPDRRYLLLYNGEIYNYLTLRTELQARGYFFQTTSDTEVVLAALITYGHVGLEKLNGMFALIFYDTQTQKLIAARDRFGIKRLYYFYSDDYLLISSEVNSLLASGLIKKKLNETQLSNYLRYRHALKPYTFFQNIYELEEGKVLTFVDYKMRVDSLVSSAATILNLERSDAEIINLTENLLLKSVERQLRADVPVGLFLSGGVDSTLILALIQQLGHRHFPAFTISNKPSESTFGSADYRFARLAAQDFGADHQPFEIDSSILKYLDELVATLDQPIADGAALLTYYLSKQVRATIKVALSGAGADELFGGYNRHQAFYHFLQHRHFAHIFLTLFKPGVGVLPTGIKHPLRKQFLLIRKLANKIQPDQPVQTFLNFTAMDEHLQQLLQPAFTGSAPPKIPANQENILRWSLNQDLHQYLIADILALTDKTSMIHSLEVRTPYLDNALHTFLQTLPPETLFKNGSKWILKHILEQYQEKQIAHRPKEGFGMPLGQWLKQNENRWIFEDLQNPQHKVFQYIRFPETQSLIQMLLQGRYDYSTELWALIILARWLGRHFDA